jgi:hypothetical protein
MEDIILIRLPLYLIVALFCCLLGRAFAQETKPIPPITDKEYADFLAKHDKALQKNALHEHTTQYQEAVAASNALNDFTAKLYTDRKLTNDDAQLCFGPQPGLCADVPDMKLEWRAKPKTKKAAEQPASAPKPADTAPKK